MNEEIKNHSSSVVIVVEASAGSGKTRALAMRYLQLLINPHIKFEEVPIKNILAITFTNKATIEMKTRILELLKQIALNSFKEPEQEKEIFSFLKVEKEFAIAKAKLVMDELIKHYNFFSIQTIDSFVNTLLSSFALNLERSSRFKIKKDFRRYIEYCFDLVIEDAHINRDIFKLLGDFLEHYLFVENRKGWFPKEDILELLQYFFEISNKYGCMFNVFDVSSKDIIKKKIYIFNKIKEIAPLLKEELNSNKVKSILTFLNNNISVFDISHLPSVFASDNPPFGKDKTYKKTFLKKWKRINYNLQRLVNLEAALTYNPYVKLFLHIFKFLQEISKKEDILFLEELNRKARLLFDEEAISVAEVYYRLATKFSHYLIDEFQDTNILQWKNLKFMIEEALSTGGSLFYVGDKKQAIYRFRGGDARLFEEVKDNFKHFNIIEKKLLKNWRSQRAIVEFNNIIFSEKNLTNMLLASGIAKELGEDKNLCREIVSVFNGSQQDFQPNYNYGYVYVERINEDNQIERNEIMKQKLLSLISDLRGRFKYTDIAILTRDNYEVELITSWLISENIAVESEKTLNIIEHYIIKEIVCFLKFLNSPTDNISFASFILGDIFTSATGIQKDELVDFIFTLHKNKMLSTDILLYQLFREKYVDVWSEYIEDFLRNVGLISHYELIINIYQRFKVYSNFSEAYAFFMKFLELVKITEDEYIGLSGFLEYLKSASIDDLYVNVVYEDAVKVLTIHKSKGLEFGVVILPFFRIDINPQTVKNINFYLINTGDDKLEFVKIIKNYCMFSPKLAKIYRQAYKNACIDELNATYVALTRAKYELYIFIPKKSNGGKNKASLLIPEGITEYGAKCTYEKKQEITQPLLYISPTSYKDWIKPIKNEFIDKEYILNKDRLLEGNVLHTILSKIGNCFKKDLKSLIKDAVNFAKLKFNRTEDFLFYEQKIRNLLNRKNLYNIFYVEDGDVFCEKEVVDKFGNLKRIDRLIVKQKEIWIIDYKSSLEKDKQAIQIQEYMHILKEIYPDKIIRGFLIYLDSFKKEEIFI